MKLADPCGCLNPIPGEPQPGGCRSTVAARHHPREPPLLMSFLYLALRKVIELALVRLRSTEYEELEIVVLDQRHQTSSSERCERGVTVLHSGSSLRSGASTPTASRRARIYFMAFGTW
jgi:hypothetical protein